MFLQPMSSAENFELLSSLLGKCIPAKRMICSFKWLECVPPFVYILI